MYRLSALATVLLTGALILGAVPAQGSCGNDPCPERATCTRVGPGCAPDGMRVPKLKKRHRFELGSSGRLEIESRSTRRASGLLPIGYSSAFSTSLGVALPLDLAPIGFPGCSLYSGGDGAVVPFVLDRHGEYTLCLDIPPFTKHCGTLLIFQALILHESCSGLELLTSNGLACTVGN